MDTFHTAGAGAIARLEAEIERLKAELAAAKRELAGAKGSLNLLRMGIDEACRMEDERKANQ